MILEELRDLLRQDAEKLGKALAMLCPWNKIFMLKLDQRVAEGMAEMLPKNAKMTFEVAECCVNCCVNQYCH